MLAPLWSLFILAPVILLAAKERPSSSPRSENNGNPLVLAIALAMAAASIAAQWLH